ncbi:hypothetical protein ACFY0G_02120 [Streptomyces sp. NPDC001552]
MTIYHYGVGALLLVAACTWQSLDDYRRFVGRLSLLTAVAAVWARWFLG